MPKGTRLMMISSTRTTSVMILMARKGDDAEGRMRTLTTRRSFSLMNSCQAHSRSSELAFSASSSSTTRSGANSRCAPTALTAVVYRTLLTASRAWSLWSFPRRVGLLSGKECRISFLEYMQWPSVTLWLCLTPMMTKMKTLWMMISELIVFCFNSCSMSNSLWILLLLLCLMLNTCCDKWWGFGVLGRLQYFEG